MEECVDPGCTHDALGGSQWGYGDPCTEPTWWGVTCDETGQHVTEMCVQNVPIPPKFQELRG